MSSARKMKRSREQELKRELTCTAVAIGDVPGEGVGVLRLEIPLSEALRWQVDRANPQPKPDALAQAVRWLDEGAIGPVKGSA